MWWVRSRETQRVMYDESTARRGSDHICLSVDQYDSTAGYYSCCCQRMLTVTPTNGCRADSQKKDKVSIEKPLQ